MLPLFPEDSSEEVSPLSDLSFEAESLEQAANIATSKNTVKKLSTFLFLIQLSVFENAYITMQWPYN